MAITSNRAKLQLVTTHYTHLMFKVAARLINLAKVDVDVDVFGCIVVILHFAKEAELIDA